MYRVVIDTEDGEYIDFFFLEVLLYFCWQFLFDWDLYDIFRFVVRIGGNGKNIMMMLLFINCVSGRLLVLPLTLIELFLTERCAL